MIEFMPINKYIFQPKKQTMKQIMKQTIIHRLSHYGFIFQLISIILFLHLNSMNGQIPAAVDNIWARDNLEMRRGTTELIITDWIWQRDFNGGELGEISINDPIGAFEDFQYLFTVKPASPDYQVKYKWEIKKTNKKSGEFKWLTTNSDGGAAFYVQIPDEIGKYKLKVTLKIYNADRSSMLRKEEWIHTLYRIHEQPIQVAGYETDWNTAVPRTAWLEVATKWAKGETNKIGILNQLNYKIHSNPFNWGYYASNCGTPGNEITLLQQEAICGFCENFRNIWRFLAAIHGISTKSLPYKPKDVATPSDKNWVVFITSTQPALDKNESANGFNKITGLADRWSFGSHAFAYHLLDNSNALVYDPTYGQVSKARVSNGNVNKSDIEKGVFCKNTATDGDKCYVLSLPPAYVWSQQDFSIPTVKTAMVYWTKNPKELKEDIQTGLLSKIPSGNTKTDIQIQKALVHLTKSLAEDLWLNDTLLTDKGAKVFKAELKAVQLLKKIYQQEHLKFKEDAIELFILIDAKLARIAINKAIEENGDPGKIVKAEKQMDKAKKDLIKGRKENAIEHYQKAWELAQKALNNLNNNTFGRSANENNTSIYAVADPNSVVLYCYAYDSEKTNKRFVIEKSTDGIHYTQLFEIDAQQHAVGTKAFSHLDKNPLTGSNFYRLKAEFTDGSFKFTKPQHVLFEPVKSFTLYPNPAETYATLDLTEFLGLQADIKVYHNSVVIISEHIPEITNRNYVLDLKNLSNGFYQVFIKADGKRAVCKKLIVIKSN